MLEEHSAIERSNDNFDESRTPEKFMKKCGIDADYIARSVIKIMEE